MSRCRQIGLVLWKNFTIRRRRWPRVVFELIWPLFLFLILMWVRTRNLVFYNDACHNDPKYLGSTGFLPALQTYICRWNNTCHNYTNPTDQFKILTDDLPNLLNQFSNFTNNLLMTLNNDQIMENLTDSLSQINNIITYISIWNGTILANNTTKDFNQSIPATTLNILFTNPVNLSNLHQSWLINRTNSLSNTDVAIEIFIVSLQSNYVYSYQTETNIKQSFCINGQFNQTFLINQQQSIQAKDFLCNNLSAIDLKNFLISVQKQLDIIFLTHIELNIMNTGLTSTQIMQATENIRSQFEILNSHFSFGEIKNNLSLTTFCGGRNDLSYYFVSNSSQSNKTLNTLKNANVSNNSSSHTTNTIFDINWDDLASDLLYFNESDMCNQSYIIGSGNVKQTLIVNRTCRCVQFDRVFNSNKQLKQFGRLVRPLLYGKIYYYPSNNHYNNIIKQINQTFESLDELTKLFRQIYSTINITYERFLPLCNTSTNSTIICQQLNSYRTLLSLFIIFTEFIACSDRNRFIPVSSESHMIIKGQNLSVTDRFLAGIVFLNEISNNDSLPKHIKYKIRMTLDTVDNTFRTEDRYFTYSPRYSAPLSTKYHSFTFIYLQNALDHAIINIQTGLNLPFGIQTQQMPYPCWINDRFVNSVRQMLPLFMVLSWIFTVSMNVKDIVYEKEKRLKEIMRIMGLNDSVHWFTWFILCFVVMITIAILLVIILKFGKITQYSNFLILFLFFVCYTFATINQCFLLSVFFNRANLAACGAGIIYFVLYLPYTLLLNYDTQVLRWHKVITCLSSTVAFGVGCDYIARFEGVGQGIQWNNINKGVKPNDNFTFLYCMIMMLVDSIIYMILTVYIENVFPGEYGIPQPWYYPFTKTYWFGYDIKKNRQRTNEIKQNQTNINTNIENDNDDVLQGELGVDIQNLSKYYRNKVALKNLSIKFYRNMITAFLGRNGAGKSTTWSILTGLIPPSNGTAYIDGYNILTDIKVIRKRLGFAPQHNILFDNLTVTEHLEFFSALKNAPQELIEDETKKMLADLGIENKSNNYSKELSGGMKRKLSIAIAFIGNSTTVILDEPTAGVDPFARRAIWDLILKYKSGRTIILSTHHLDEADLLSDRLAIISSGELQCVGTTMHLKHKYGEGYNLIVELISTEDENKLRKQQQQQQQADSINNILDPISIELNINNSNTNSLKRFEPLTEFLKSYMSDIRIKEEHGDQITYIIIDNTEHTKIFPKMLADLDENQTKYYIKNYGLSNSSLEQVFLRVADEKKRTEDYERLSSWKRMKIYIKRLFRKNEIIEEEIKNEEINDEENNDNQEQFNTCLSDEWSSYAEERYTGLYYLIVQISGLLIKRFHRTKRNIKALIAELFLPIFFVLLAMLVTKLAPNQSEPPPLILHPWYWDQPNYMFQSLPINNTSLLSKYIHKTFIQSPSLGTRCMKTTMLDKELYPCDTTNIGYTPVSMSNEIMNALNNVNYNQTRISPNCDCWEKMQTCPIGAGGPQPSFDITETKDTLYRLSDYNITDWIIKTEFHEEYLMKRHGGFDFLPQNNLNNIDLLNEELINRLMNIINQTDQSVLKIDIAKIASLFRIHPPKVSVWYNNKAWPSSVAFLNLFNNALLRGRLLEKNSSISIDDYGITAISHPLPQTEIQIDSELQNRISMEMFTAICVIFALAFVPASFLVFLIDEQVTTSKHLQFVSGVKGITYWWANFLWDLTNYCVSIGFCIIIFLSFGIEAYVYKMNFLCLFLLLFLYGFAIIPIMYPISYLFRSPATGFVVISSINIFIGLMTTISTITIENFSDEPDLKNINAILTKLFLIFPHYCLGRGLFDLSKTHATNVLSLKYVLDYVPISPFKFDVVGRNLLCLCIEGVFFCIFAILVQYRFFIPDHGCVSTPNDLISSNEDDDVAAERQRIYSDRNNTSGDVLRMIDLVKIYGLRLRKKLTAVKKTCVGVKQGECFGLLGINGSGKTTTFKMLTGEISITDGRAFVNNYSVIKQLSAVHKNIGYCPQFDALDSLLTAREHLYLYARLRGIKRTNIPFITDCLLKRLGLTLWADRPVKQYSGGNKRKLSTAISLIGNPSIIFMDEPTTGMDVRAKRFLWNCILTLTRKDHKSVIITSHSMEECETLCNRLVIMVNGEFKCLGSVQHLKTKFGDGYRILVRTEINSDRKNVINYIKEQIPEADIKEEHNKMIHFRVSTNVPLYKMFSVLEKARENFKSIIEDYTITQVTLDDVFVTFAKIQEENQTLEQINNTNTNEDNCLKKNFFYKLFYKPHNNIIELTKL
ncbi:unnamed protein product [Rotaria sordida]|uniref:ABC transporter domain-containing protein n=1 Tax=Rotaria sordida TaxID=392033 RepID=A0A814HLU0_9BILA|nr:unnamed protein product [Rotaria sordida]CAF1159707.1 unnamed protein product [Rotaria sordida]